METAFTETQYIHSIMNQVCSYNNTTIEKTIETLISESVFFVRYKSNMFSIGQAIPFERLPIGVPLYLDSVEEFLKK